MYPLRFWLLLSLTLLSGCGRKSGSTEEHITPSALQLNTVIHAPSSSSKTDKVHVVVQLLNMGASSVVSSFAVASICAPITITGVDETGIQKNNVSLSVSIPGYNQDVGSGKACWNGLEGATLACGETCSQTISYSVTDNTKIGSINGNLIFTTKSIGVIAKNNLVMDTVFDSSTVKQSLPTGLSPGFSIRPNGQFTVELNNNSNQVLNTIYVDLSGINNLLGDTMGYELTGNDGYYDANSQHWIFPGLESNKGVSFSYTLKDTLAQKLKEDPSLQTNLINNGSSNPVISIGATNYQQGYPTISVNTVPYDYVQDKRGFSLTQSQVQDTIQLILPGNSVDSLILSSLSGELPEGVSISSTLAQGQALKPGKGFIITSQATPQASGNSGKVFLTFTGANGQIFSDSLNIALNTMTTLTNQQNNLILVGSSDLTNPMSTIELKIYNTGNFIAQLPTDLVTAFNLDGLSLASHLPQTCQNNNLEPGESCTIALVAPIGMNKIADIKTIGDGKNILADISLAKIQVFENTSDVAIIAPNPFPNKIKAGESVSYQVNLTPITGDLEIQKIDHPAGINPSQCQWIGDNLPVDNLLKNGLKYTYQCAVTPTAGELITGKITIHVKQGETAVEIDAPLIQTEGVNESELPLNGINLSSNVVFGLGKDITFTLKNNTTTAMTGLKIDLSGLSSELRQALALTDLTKQDPTISYNAQTGLLSINDTLLSQDSKAINFYLDTSPDNLAALKANEDKINSNLIQKQAVKLMSQTAQDVYPSLVVNSNIVEGIPGNILSLNSDNQTSFMLNNNTNEDLEIAISFTDQDVQQALQQQIISMKEKGILANGDAAITLSLPANSTLLPGVYSGNLTLTEAGDKQSYSYEIRLSISNSKLTVVSSNMVADIPAEGTSETPIVLRNDGTRDLFGISLTDSFVVTDQSGNIIDPGLISFTDPAQGGSITGIIQPNQQATLGVVLHASDSWIPGATYYVSSQSTSLSNLEAGSLFSFKIDDISPGLVIDTKSALPSQVLPGKTLSYEALITNDPLLDAYTYKVTDVIVTGGGIDFDPDLAVGADKYLFTIDALGNKQGATLTPEQSATLKFDLTLSQGESFNGELTIKVEALDAQGTKIGERDLKIVSINTNTRDNLEPISLQTASLTLRPGTSSQMLINHTEGLNNAYLDLSQMPVDVYNELTQIQIVAQNKSLTFGQAQLSQYQATKIIPLGYLVAPVSGTEINLSFAVTAGNILDTNKANLENSAIPPIQVGAANSLPIAPSIIVYTTVLDAQPVQVDTPSVETITFNNASNYPVLIENLITDNLPKGATLKDAGTCIQGSSIPVGGNCQAQVEITEAAEGEGELILEYSIQELVSQVFAPQAFKLNVQNATLRISSKVNVSNVSTSIQVQTAMKIPLPQSAEGTKNKYLVTVQNTGNFNLNAVSGLTIADNVALFDKEGNLYTDTKTELLKTDASISQSCDVATLNAHSSCQMVVAVDRDSQKADGLNLKFKNTDLFSNLDTTKINLLSAVAHVVNEDPSISLSEYGDSAPIVSTLNLEQLNEDSLRIVVQNVGGSNLIFGTNPISINNSTLSNKPVITNNTCADSSLLPQQSCEFYIQGQTTLYDTVSEVLLIKIVSANALVENSFSLNYLSERIKKLATGRWHGCYLTTKGNVYCWGRNGMGDLGRGFDSTYQTTPEKIKIDGALAGKTVEKISVRNQHACVIDTQGEGYCWGANSYGELANTPYGYQIHVSAPTQIQKGSLLASLSFRQIDIGSSHTCAIGSDNAAYCWGASSNYRLGFQPATDSYSTPVSVNMSYNGFINTNLDDISTGIGSHTCAIDQNNKLYCWGYNHRKQLGADGSGFYNTVYISESPVVPLFPITDSKVTKVVNNYRNTCALTLQNNIYCWGSNESGMLGINDSNYSQYNVTSTPQKIVMPSNVGSEIIDLDMADGTACFVDSNYDVYCWGANSWGTIAQPGDTAIIYPKPTKISLPSGVSDIDFDQVSVGEYFACASERMTTNVYCWGSNAFGQIGSGIPIDSSSYTSIPTLVQ